MRRAAHGLARMEVEADVLLTSPLPRAAETADIVATVIAGVPPPKIFPALATGTGAVELLRQLGAFADVGRLMIVGHEPTLSGLIALLLTGSPDGAAIVLKKGAVARVDVGRLASRGEASLRWLLPPVALRRMARRQ